MSTQTATVNKTEKRVNVRYLTVTAMLSAVAYILMFLDFSVPFMPAFIKMDLSELPALIGSFAMGPLCGVVVCLIKNVLHLFITTTGGVGELSNFILGVAFVLPAGKTYVLNSGETVIEFAHSVHFVTPQTLEDYPTFSFDNAFRIVEGGVVDKVTFKRINLRASKSLSEVADNSLSGKQVICPESDVFLINTIDFTNCYIENFRSIVRSKKATGNVGAIAFKECTINAIGNQGIVSTDGKNGNYINDVSFDECTITNICGIADLRNSSSGKSISITNTTFCYAPMENSFLFRVDPSIAVKIENCVFGGSMKIDGKLPKFNELGSGGQDDYTGVYPFSSVNSFQANDRTSSKGNLGLSDSKMSTTTLFTAPGTNNFKLNELFTGCSSVGASKWRR
jgi:hypothetical protein